MLFIRFVLITWAPCLLVSVIGLSFIGMAFYLFCKSQQTQQGLEISGNILHSTVKEILVKNQKRYQTAVSYEYVVKGRPYRSQRLLFGNDWRVSLREFAEGRIFKYQPGMNVRVYYNCDQPKEAVLEKGGARFLGLWSDLAVCLC